MDKWYRKDTNKVRNEKEGNPLYERGNTHLLMSLIFANLNTRPTPRKKYCVIDVVRPDAPPPPLPTQPLIYPLQCGITLAWARSPDNRATADLAGAASPWNTLRKEKKMTGGRGSCQTREKKIWKEKDFRFQNYEKLETWAGFRFHPSQSFFQSRLTLFTFSTKGSQSSRYNAEHLNLICKLHATLRHEMLASGGEPWARCS